MDNTGNDTDVYAKLVHVGPSNYTATRRVFIRAGQSFMMEKVSVGQYEIRYQWIDGGDE